MSILELPYFRHLLGRQGSLEKTMILGKIEGSRRRGRPNMRWMTSIKSHKHKATEAEQGCSGQDIVDIT